METPAWYGSDVRENAVAACGMTPDVLQQGSD